MTTFSFYKKHSLKTGITLLLAIISLFFSDDLTAQKGLEKIIVEKYYISSDEDTIGNRFFGELASGSVTYRIYLDMLPKYRFYAAYGAAGHELKIETSTVFFNNGNLGNTTPNVIPRRSLGGNTLMLDSWLSVGAAGENMYGVLKEQDDTLNTIVHEGSFMKSKNKLAGYPVSSRDGMQFSIDTPSPSFFGIDTMLAVFFKKNVGSVLSTTNGAWGCLGGAMGIDSLTTNRVLIAQLTTNGELNFELNIQIGIPDVTIERYVARNPVQDEILFPGLIYSSKAEKLTASKAKKPANKK